MSAPRWRPLLAWAVTLVPVWIVLMLGTYWEPIVRDSWGHIWWHHATDVSLYEFAQDTYRHNNPRIGQVITWLLCSPGPWHVIVTPIVELAMIYLLATLALGRWPSLKRTDDALGVATILAMVLWTCPLVGPMLFYRPFTGNYLYGLLLSLAFLVPYRLHVEAVLTPRRWLAPLIAIIGLAAGLANEHTGPTVGALALLAVIVRRRDLQLWMVVGLVAFIAGSAALFFAPGQDLRYEGLATQQSVVERIVARGFGNLDIVTLLLRYVRALGLWLVLGAVAYWSARGARSSRSSRSSRSTRSTPASPAEPAVSPRTSRTAWILVGASLAITLTLLASPKQGGRLYLASVAFASAGVAAIVLPQLTTWWSRAIAWTLAALLAGRVGYKLVTVYAAVGPQAHDRLAKIMSAPKGSTLTLPAYTQPRSRWFMGDDFVHIKWRRHVAEGWGLAAIDLVGATPLAGDGPADD